MITFTLPDGWIVENVCVTEQGSTLCFRNGYYLHILSIARGEVSLEDPNGNNVNVASAADFPDLET